MNCKICGGACYYLLSSKLSRTDFDLTQVLYECSQCNFLFSTMLDEFSSEDYSLFYKYPKYLDYDPVAKREVNESFLNRCYLQVSGVKNCMKLMGSKDPKVLVYGNGMSVTPKLLMNMGIETYSYMGHTNFGTEISDLSKYKNQFDIIVSAEVAEHFTFPLAEFEQVKHILKPGGRTVFTTECRDRKIQISNGSAWAYLHYMISDICKNAGHVSNYSKKSVEIIAKELQMKNHTYDVGDNKVAIMLEKV